MLAQFIHLFLRVWTRKVFFGVLGALLVTGVTVSSISLFAQRQKFIVRNSDPIPFQLVDNRIFVEVIIRGRKSMFILDTGGNSPTIVNFQLASELGLQLTPGMPISGAGSEPMKAYRSEVDSLFFGGVLMIAQPIVVTSFDEIRQSLNLPFLDGIISSELFYRFTVTVDYRLKKLFLHDPALYQSEKGAVRIPFVLLSDMPSIDVIVEGVNGRAVVDTGDRSAFTLFKNYAKDNGYFQRPDLGDTTMTGYGLGGPIMGRFFTMYLLQLGDIQLRDIRARIPTISGGAFDRRDEIIGSVGNGVLARFQSVTFDYRRKSMDVVQ